MRYQYILNNKIVFETNDITEYFMFLMKNEQLKNSVLFNLLNKAGKYTANMIKNNNN